MAEEDANKKGSSSRVAKYADNILPMVSFVIIRLFIVLINFVLGSSEKDHENGSKYHGQHYRRVQLSRMRGHRAVCEIPGQECLRNGFSLLGLQKSRQVRSRRWKVRLPGEKIGDYYFNKSNVHYFSTTSCRTRSPSKTTRRFSRRKKKSSPRWTQAQTSAQAQRKKAMTSLARKKRRRKKTHEQSTFLIIKSNKAKHRRCFSQLPKKKSQNWISFTKIFKFSGCWD